MDATLTVDGTGLREGRLTRRDGRTVAWTTWGDPDGTPLVRLHGMPGCRLPIGADPLLLLERHVSEICVERPGYGASTALPGRGFSEPADDVAAVLDALAINSVPISGGSGATPYVLAFAARHPSRVRAATIVGGTAPLAPDEFDALIDFAATAQGLAERRDTEGLSRFLDAARDEFLADPLGAFTEIMATAPPADQAILADPAWQASYVRSTREALRPGIVGWLDDCLADAGDWAELDLAAVRTSVTWWHSVADRNCPIAAAARLVGQLPNARLVAWPDEGHLTAYHRGREILDELLARA